MESELIVDHTLMENCGFPILNYGFPLLKLDIVKQEAVEHWTHVPWFQQLDMDLSSNSVRTSHGC